MKYYKKLAFLKNTYIEALKLTHQGRTVILKQNPSDSYTNGCNHDILLLWGANIDFQFVLDKHSTVCTFSHT